MVPILIATICGVLGLVVAVFMAIYVLKQEQGSEKVREFSIKEPVKIVFLRSVKWWVKNPPYQFLGINGGHGPLYWCVVCAQRQSRIF